MNRTNYSNSILSILIYNFAVVIAVAIYLFGFGYE